MTPLRRITEVPVNCLFCEWSGVTGDCEPDGDGCLCCPQCGVIADILYSEHELNPK